MARQFYNLVAHDWIQLEGIINDLAFRVLHNPNLESLTLVNTITEFSTDGTFADNSDSAVPTEKAIATYVGSAVASNHAFKTITGIADDVVADAANDTLTLASANARLTVVGTPASDTITFTVDTDLHNYSWTSVDGADLKVGSVTQAYSAVLDDLNTLGVAASDGQFIVGTGAGAFAYESGDTARTSLGLGTGDSPTWENINLTGTGVNPPYILSDGSPLILRYTAGEAGIGISSDGIGLLCDSGPYGVNVAGTLGMFAVSADPTTANGATGIWHSDGTETGDDGDLIIQSLTSGGSTTTTNFTQGLAPIAGLSRADSNFIVGNGTTWVAESGDTARTSLGLGTGDSVTFLGVTSGAVNIQATGADPVAEFRSDSNNSRFGTLGEEMCMFSRGNAIVAIDSNNNSTANYFAVVKNTAYISSSTELLRVTESTNMLLGGTTSPATATNSFGLYTGTAPTGSLTDGVVMYSKDFAAGNACPYFRTEGGTVIGLNQSLLTTDSVTFGADMSVSNAGAESIMSFSGFDTNRNLFQQYNLSGAVYCIMEERASSYEFKLGTTLEVAINSSGITSEAGVLCLKESTTPSAVTNYGKIYTKSDNKVYFQDGSGTEHEIAFV